jgi:hypothetical protein
MHCAHERESPSQAGEDEPLPYDLTLPYDRRIVLYLQVIYIHAVHLEPLNHWSFRQNASKAGTWERH